MTIPSWNISQREANIFFEKYFLQVVLTRDRLWESSSSTSWDHSYLFFIIQSSELSLHPIKVFNFTVMLICMSGSSPGLYFLFIPWYNLAGLEVIRFLSSMLWNVLSSLARGKNGARIKRRVRVVITIVVLHLITHHQLFGCSFSCKCHVWAILFAVIFFSCKFACHSSPSWTFDVTSGWCNTYDNFIPLLSHALPLLPLWTQSNRSANQNYLAQVAASLSTAAVQQSHMLALIDQSVDTCLYTRS